MSKVIHANVMDLANNTHIIETYSNELWLIFIIIILLFTFRIKSLILQYIITTLILFIYSPIYGITYANLIFFLYHFFLFININNIYVKIVLFMNILVSLVLILLKLINVEYKNYITVPVINMFTLLSNLYFVFMWYKTI
jgi:hypothetical protein